jgi:hypothetical protein
MNASLASIGAKRESMTAHGAPAQWLVPELQMFPLAARRCTVRNPLTGASLELSSGEYAVLSACDGCAPLAEHEARAARQLSAPLEHRPAIRELLERCARSGLLMALADLVARFGAPQETIVPPFAGIAVRTCDRPGELRRVLESAIALQARTGATYPWHVVDDSHRAESPWCRRSHRIRTRTSSQLPRPVGGRLAREQARRGIPWGSSRDTFAVCCGGAG